MNDSKPHGQAPLLHNMSVPPKSVINHSGWRNTGLSWWLELPHLSLAADEPLPIPALAAWVGADAEGNDVEQERILRARLNAHSEELPLPPACVVVTHQYPEATVISDPLTIATVLAKSSGHVYLRDKEPNLGRLKAGAGLTLMIHPERSA